MKNKIVIKCPKCGREYLPCEIYLPKYFFGTAKAVSRDDSGCIDFVDGEEMDLCEEFECDCGTKFEVLASIEFTTKESKDESEEGYVSSL